MFPLTRVPFWASETRQDDFRFPNVNAKVMVSFKWFQNRFMLVQGCVHPQSIEVFFSLGGLEYGRFEV